MSDLARPNGPGCRPSDQSTSCTGGKAASIPRAKRKPSAECLIAEYIAAYKAANKEQPNFRIVHVAGWVQFRSRHSSMVIERKRLGYLPTMTKRLRDRAAAQGIEARSAETSGSAEGESPVTEGHAPQPQLQSQSLKTESAA